ncbi:hypothetical protein JTE90_025072 [Oedothorax gibbosus]|uniref:BZIP domain-containing protein n=1 Tax=Oedothorax gibbosus TaxID=931172 RepID=A0AAV6U825_9ARAC|nr:hypothetical protein JTE90_025072 [Oedothorax gibbosus]
MAFFHNVVSTTPSVFLVPNDYGFNFDEILRSSNKTNDDADLITGLPDLDWLDAQADLSVLDESKGFNIQPFEIEDPLNPDDADLLLDLIDNSILNASYLSSDLCKANLQDILSSSTHIEQPIASSKVSDLPMSLPFYEPICEVSSPTSCTSGSVCPSPSGSSSIDDGFYESISEASSPASFADSAGVTVTVCDMDVTSIKAEPMCLDEVTQSVRRRKYVRDNLKEIPKVKVTLKDAFHPYAKAAPSKRSLGKKERKKVQNKEAAARYRIKKRIEEGHLSGEVEDLEKEQEGLRKKHDDLLSEIKYLKNLMKEVLQKKGIM